jgi:hypothetical protein
LSIACTYTARTVHPGERPPSSPLRVRPRDPLADLLRVVEVGVLQLEDPVGDQDQFVRDRRARSNDGDDGFVHQDAETQLDGVLDVPLTIGGDERHHDVRPLQLGNQFRSDGLDPLVVSTLVHNVSANGGSSGSESSRR